MFVIKIKCLSFKYVKIESKMSLTSHIDRDYTPHGGRRLLEMMMMMMLIMMIFHCPYCVLSKQIIIIWPI